MVAALTVESAVRLSTVPAGTVRERGIMARVPLPEAQSLALRIAAGRTLAAAAIMAAPVASARALGTDTATAQRVVWLTRMLAVRDGALGIGGAAAARRGSGTSWLLAGAASDAVDAVVLTAALRQGRIKGIVPSLTVPFAAGAAVLGALAGLGLRRRRADDGRVES